jgi:hypothetical protein
MLRLTRRSLCSFLFLRRRQSTPPSLLPEPRHQWFFSYSRRWNWSSGGDFWLSWRDPDRIAERDKDAEVKWLPEVFPIMEIPLELLYQCQRGLLRRKVGRTEISVSVKAIVEELRKLLGITTYDNETSGTTKFGGIPCLAQQLLASHSIQWVSHMRFTAVALAPILEDDQLLTITYKISRQSLIEPIHTEVAWRQVTEHC